MTAEIGFKEPNKRVAVAQPFDAARLAQDCVDACKRFTRYS